MCEVEVHVDAGWNLEEGAQKGLSLVVLVEHLELFVVVVKLSGITCIEACNGTCTCTLVIWEDILFITYSLIINLK